MATATLTDGVLITVFGIAALSFMVAMYAQEHRGNGFVLAFAIGCGLASLYGFASGAWPFGIVEALWGYLAFRRYMKGERVWEGLDSELEALVQNSDSTPDPGPATAHSGAAPARVLFLMPISQSSANEGCGCGCACRCGRIEHWA